MPNHKNDLDFFEEFFCKNIIKNNQKFTRRDKGMLNCIESAYRENRVLFNNGKLTAKIEMVKELLKIKMPISQISQVTHFTEEKIKEIEKGTIS